MNNLHRFEAAQADAVRLVHVHSGEDAFADALGEGDEITVTLKRIVGGHTYVVEQVSLSGPSADYEPAKPLDENTLTLLKVLTDQLERGEREFVTAETASPILQGLRAQLLGRPSPR